jgi:hypothetical protein
MIWWLWPASPRLAQNRLWRALRPWLVEVLLVGTLITVALGGYRPLAAGGLVRAGAGAAQPSHWAAFWRRASSCIPHRSSGWRSRSW